jgi:phosphodiesterase/alkaline phosphatase D-like protein
VTSLDRRRFLTLTAAAAAVPLLPVRALADTQPDPALAPFLHGVASGDPLSDRVVLWTRVTQPQPDAVVEVQWLVATDPGLQQVVTRGSAVAAPERDHTVKLDVAGLAPRTTYYYAFTALGRRSMIGRTLTAPAPGQDVNRLRFAVATCAKYETGFFHAYARIAEADVDAVLHCGDYLYESRMDSDTVGGRAPEPETEVRTLAEYRIRHALYKTDPDLQRVHQQHPMVATWDDHESANDSWVDGAAAHDPETEGPWPVRKAAAQQVYDEWMPVRLPVPGDPTRVYRQLPHGDLVDLVVLDTRLEGRSKQLEGLDGDQVIVDPAVADPARQMYSPAQRAFVEQALSGSRAAWKLVVNQVLVSQLRAAGFPQEVSAVLASLGQSGVPSEGVALAADIWDGYVAERERLLGFLREAMVHDVVVLTGDIHVSLANDLTEDPFDLLTPPAAVEFVTPSVSNTNFDEGLGVPPRTTSLAIEQSLKVQNPSTKYAELDSNGWVLLDVTAERVQAEWLFVDATVEGSQAQRLDATFQVLRGANRLSQGGPRTTDRNDRPLDAPPPQVVDVPAVPPGGAGTAVPAAPARSATAGRDLPATGLPAGPVVAAGLLALAAVLRRRIGR